jgi:hypothetical protein
MKSPTSFDLPLFCVGGEIGWIFAGEFPLTYCFVPENSILFHDDGPQLDEVTYFRSGWAERNFRANDGGAGHYLFPNLSKPVTKSEGEATTQFLHRTETLYASAGDRPATYGPRLNSV